MAPDGEPAGLKMAGFSLRTQIDALEPELLAAITRVLHSGQFIMGDEVKSLEAQLSTVIGAPALGVANGSDALYLSLLALHIGRGDEVVTTPFTFFATAGSILRTGARPVFADVDPDTFNLDPAAALSRVTPRTRALLPVHLFGLMADLASLEARFQGPIVEDAAQAILATREGRQAGTVGHLACFSFFPTKNLGAFGDAGLVTSRVPELYQRVAKLRVHGASRQYYHEMMGINSRLDALQAAILAVKLPHLETWTARREAIALRYRTGLAAIGVSDVVRPQIVVPGARHVYHQFTVRAERRDALAAHLQALGIDTKIYYPVALHRMPVFSDLGYREGEFPVAEALTRDVLSLPLYPELPDHDVDRVVEAIGRFYGAAS